MKIADILKLKERPLITIAPDETAQAAIQKLVENNIGALPVCDAKGTLLGIISERDLLKECSRRVGAITDTRVKQVMTREVAIGTPEDDLDYIMSTMTQKGIRHLPIMAGQELAGMLSIRDIVDLELEESQATVRYLSDYMSGGYV